MREFTVQNGSATLACEERGSGPVVVALHAGVADRRSWREMGEALDGFRLVTYDRRGFGETTYEAEEFAHVDDLKAVIDAIGVTEPVVLLGNSMGGSLALEFALAYPEQVRAMLLLATAVSGAPWEPVPSPADALEVALQAANKAGDVDEVNRLEAHFWLDGPVASEGRVTGAARELFLDMNGIALRATSPGTEQEQPEVWDRLPGLHAPTLVAYGDQDEPVMLPIWEALAERLPNGRSVRLPGVAHLPQMEQPEAIAALVREVASQG